MPHVRSTSNLLRSRSLRSLIMLESTRVLLVKSIFFLLYDLLLGLFVLVFAFLLFSWSLLLASEGLEVDI